MISSERNIATNNTLQNIFDSKIKRHAEDAKLPIEKKLEILIKSQKIGFEVLRARGKQLPGLKRVWTKD